MKRSVIPWITALAMVLVLAAPVTAVTNGHPDEEAHPYVGLIAFDIDIPGVGIVPAGLCSGALIAPTVVLTAAHCTQPAVSARVWFAERIFDDDGTPLVPDFPFGGVEAVEGTPVTNPEFAIGSGPGLPGFAYRDVGLVLLDEPVEAVVYAALPEAGLVDTLRSTAPIDLVGYGVTMKMHVPGDGAPFWVGPLSRLGAPSELISGNFVHSSEFIKLSMNPGRDRGGFCFGDSGGPDLLGGTDTVLAVNSYVTSGNCSGVGYSNRVDVPEILDWIQMYLP